MFIESGMDAPNHIISGHASTELFVGQLVTVFNEICGSIASSSCWIEVMN
jgi:hypothetical protein